MALLGSQLPGKGRRCSRTILHFTGLGWPGGGSLSSFIFPIKGDRFFSVHPTGEWSGIKTKASSAERRDKESCLEAALSVASERSCQGHIGNQVALNGAHLPGLWTATDGTVYHCLGEESERRCHLKVSLTCLHVAGKLTMQRKARRSVCLTL